MKKIFLLMFFMFNFKICANAMDYRQFCPAQENTASIGGAFMSATGVNFISRNIIEAQIASVLKKETNSKFDVKINSFLGSNIFEGSFKSFSAKAKQYSINGVCGSDLVVETICPYNKVSYINNKLKFDNDLVLKYSTNITQEDLDKTIQSSVVQEGFSELNKDKFISSLFKIETPKVEIKNKKLYINYTLIPLPALNISSIANSLIKPIRASFSADLKVVDNKLELTNVEFNSSKIANKYLALIDKLNPTSFKIKLNKTTKSRIDIENVEILDSKIAIKGYAIIPKNK